MITVKVKTEGFRDLEKALFQLKKATAKNATRRAMKTSLEPVKQKMIGLAPYNPETGADGHVRDEIHISSKAKDVRKQSDLEVYCGVSTKQGRVASLQEWGTVHHAAQPFARPAWEAEKMNVLVSFKDHMWTEIDKATARAQRKAEREARKMKAGI